MARRPGQIRRRRRRRRRRIRRCVFRRRESWRRRRQDCRRTTTTVGHLCAIRRERMRGRCRFRRSCYYFCHRRRHQEEQTRGPGGGEGMARRPGQVRCRRRRRRCVSRCRESWRRQDCRRSTTVGHLCEERMHCCCYFCCFRRKNNARESHLDSVSSLSRCKTFENRRGSR